jgi:hypothetical protein
VPLYGLLKNQAFQPEQIQAMVFAFESICQERALRPIRDDVARERVAERVIEFARRGVVDPQKLRDAVAETL